jgi:hypothetical protein
MQDRPGQHWLDVGSQASPEETHWLKSQAGSALQSVSSQSIRPSQSSSTPPEHTSAPVEQSSEQFPQVSPESQISSPQQKSVGTIGVSSQENPPVVQRASSQPAGFNPSASPQQKRPDGLPFNLPLQSEAQFEQFSPAAV